MLVFSVLSLYVEICALSASQLDRILTWNNNPVIAAQWICLDFKIVVMVPEDIMFHHHSSCSCLVTILGIESLAVWLPSFQCSAVPTEGLVPKGVRNLFVLSFAYFRWLLMVAMGIL